jgi:aspartate/methionine/tyrosine aminotransferase
MTNADLLNTASHAPSPGHPGHGVTVRLSPTLSLAEEIDRARREGQSVLSLSTPTFPEITEANAIDFPFSNKLTPAEGLAPLRKAAREEFFGRWVLPDHQLFISAGAKIAEFAAMRAVLPEQSTVLIVGPAWPSYEDIVRMAGYRPVMLQLDPADNFTIRAGAVAEAFTASGAGAMILSNPCNPSGRVHTGEELAILMDQAESRGAFLMVDESFSNVMFDAAAWQRAVTRPSEYLLLFNSFSKNYHLQGLRVGVCMAHVRIYKQVVAAHQTLMSSAPSLSQAAALATLRHSDSIPASSHYLASRAIALEIVERNGWQCSPNQGTFYIFPKLPQAEQTLARMRAEGLYPLSGDAFGARYGDHFRFCFGRPEEEMVEIRRRLERAGLLGQR